MCTEELGWCGSVGVWDGGGVWEEADAGEPRADGLGVIKAMFLC